MPNRIYRDPRCRMPLVKTSPKLVGVLVCAAAIGAGCVVLAQSGAASGRVAAREWPTYGHDPGNMRFSPLTQITPANVGRLSVAWTYHMKPAAETRLASSEVTPL